MRPEIEAEWQGGPLQSVSPHAEFDRRSGGWSVRLDDDGCDEDHGDPDDIDYTDWATTAEHNRLLAGLRDRRGDDE